jgi:cytochrome c-type biogenesis protein CcmH/NrfF
MLSIRLDPQFITCDDPLQERTPFLYGFPVNATLFSSKLLLRSEQFRHKLGTDLSYFQIPHQNRVMDVFPI